MPIPLTLIAAVQEENAILPFKVDARLDKLCDNDTPALKTAVGLVGVSNEVQYPHPSFEDLFDDLNRTSYISSFIHVVHLGNVVCPNLKELKPLNPLSTPIQTIPSQTCL
jgi:hypothetical protein